MPPAPPGYAQPACPRSAAGQVVYLHAWPAVGQRARALELSSARTRQRRPTAATAPRGARSGATERRDELVAVSLRDRPSPVCTLSDKRNRRQDALAN